jgi:DNA polymerase elongation subunit (family B)
MISIEQLEDRLRVSHFNKEGEVQFKEIPIPRTEKYKWEPAGSERKDPFYTSWDGKPVKKVKSFWLNRFRIEEYMSSLGEEYLKDIYEFNNPETWFCDIEVEVTDEFPDPAIAKTAVTAVALVNSKAQTFVLGTKPLTSQQIQNIEKRYKEHLKDYNPDPYFEYFYFQSESEMLMTLFSKWFKDAPLITGWNFIHFDWKFLINRCKRLGVDPSSCSLNGQLVGEDQLPMHKVVVDYLDLYKKWDRVVKIKENNKLDTVAKAALGVEKIKYNGSLTDLYNNDFETYIFYNAVDTYLVYLINKKINTMQTFLMLGNVTRVEAMKAFSPIWMTECIMTREFYQRKKVIAETKKSSKSHAFEGAYVKDPRKGLHQHLATFDFASLYPSTMRQWNISPETFLGKNIDVPEEKKVVNCASGAIFDNSEDSVMRTVLADFYNKRKESKKKSFEIEKEIDFLKKSLRDK